MTRRPQGPNVAGSASAREPRSVALKLLDYCNAHDWAGYDPYDALNSRLFAAVPLLDARLPRLVMTQILKRLRWNVRPILAIPVTQNPKAIALFLSSLLKLHRLELLANDTLIDQMVVFLETLRAKDTPYWCWGYSFPWQTRTIIVPRGAPNLVCTTFVANAVLDLYEARGIEGHLDMAVSAADYIYNELCWTDGAAVSSIAYPLPTSRTPIHNANLMGAALLCRVAKISGRQRYLASALAIARYSESRQRPDGSWAYGEADTQQWVDNFHTGYNLMALRSLSRNCDTTEFEHATHIGFDYYRRHFFREDGAPRYFHDQTYPIDIHCVAQSVISLLEFRDLNAGAVELARSVLDWAIAHMWDPRGFFYYRALRTGRIKTSYMRWSQAWMLLALATWLESIA